MTNEERDKAIRILQWLHDNIFLFASTEEDVKYATKLGIQALEQDDVLDKIRAEIGELNPVDYVSMSSYLGHRGISDMKDDVLEIIDKYKVEKER